MVNSEKGIEEMAHQPLHNRWVWWYDNQRLAPPGSSWKENLKNCGTFDTPASFWTLANNVRPPSQLSLNSNYHVFKEGIEPMWEDPENKDGGKWVLTFSKKDPRNRRCDEWWLFTVLAMIGETMDTNGDMVCGAVVSIRKSQDRIALWLKTDDKDTAVHIGARWKKALEISHKLKYQVHRDAAATGSSFRNEIVYEV